MKIFHCLFLLIALLKIGIEAASTEIVSDSPRNEEKEGKDSEFDLLSFDLIVKIGVYLDFPHKELGLMNRRFHSIFFEYFPLIKFLRSRFDIPELQNSDYSNYSSILLRLSHVRDPGHFIISVTTAVWHERILGCNKETLYRFISRSYSAFSDDLITRFLDEQNVSFNQRFHFAFLFMLSKDYQKALSISKSCSTMDLIEKVFNQSYDLKCLYDFISFLLKSNLNEDYRLILKNIYQTEYLTNFFVASILAKVPKSFYIDKLCKFGKILEWIVTNICTNVFQFSSDFDVVPVLFEIFDVAQARNYSVDVINYLKLMVRIRFGTESDEVIQNEIISNCNRRHELLGRLLLASCQADKNELSRFIYFLDEPELRSYYHNRIRNNYDIKVFSIIPEFELILDDFFYFLRLYKIRGIRYDAPNSAIYISMKCIDTQSNLPEIYVFKMKETRRNVSKLLKNIFKHFDTDESIDGIRSRIELTIEALLQIPFAFDASTAPRISPSLEVLLIIAETPSLLQYFRNARIELELGSFKVGKFFEKSVTHLSGTVKFNMYSQSKILYSLVTNTQIANFEAFTGKEIAFWFEQTVTIYSSEDSREFFYRHSVVFHYWFNGPHRDRLMNYLSPEMLQLLAKEVDPESAEIIQTCIARKQANLGK